MFAVVVVQLLVCDSLQPHGLYSPPPRLFFPWGSLGKNIAVGCHFLLQGIFLDPGIKPMCPAFAGELFTTQPPGRPDCMLQDFLEA